MKTLLYLYILSVHNGPICVEFACSLLFIMEFPLDCSLGWACRFQTPHYPEQDLTVLSYSQQ